MTVAAEPLAVLSPLPRADGSATYSHAGYTITASANGPIEAQRRDEDPDEATVDVVVRPAAGVGGQSSCRRGVGVVVGEVPSSSHVVRWTCLLTPRLFCIYRSE